MILLFNARPAGATASFARQTGLACSACHTTPPELTEYGREFKLKAYTDSKEPGVKEEGKGKQSGLELLESLPFSLNLRASGTHTGNVQPGTRNTSSEVPQQLNFWIAGKVYQHAGSYVQLTYDAQGDHFSFDNSDVRYARSTKLGGKDLTWGIDFNNDPTWEDLWHSTPAYGYPWVAPDATPSPAAAAIIDGPLGHDVVGIGGYFMWDSHLYGNMEVYRSQHIGEAQPSGGTGFPFNISGAAPYWRVAYQASKGSNYFEAGTYGMYMQSFPNAITGPTDVYTDTAVDFTYERSFKVDSLSVHATYIHETNSLDATFLAGGASQASHHLNTARWDANYHFGNKYRLTVGNFFTSGTADTVIYAPAAVSGSANGSPKTSGYVGEVAYWPVQNLEIGLSYRGYFKFNGASHNYDGSGRAASGNNTSYLYLLFNF